MKYRYAFLVASIVFLVISSGWLYFSAEAKDIGSVISGTPDLTILNINAITTKVGSDGSFPDSPYDYNSDNGSFPKGIATVIHREGIIWGGILKDGGTDEVRIGGNTYRSGLQPGAILGMNTGSTRGSTSDGARRSPHRGDPGPGIGAGGLRQQVDQEHLGAQRQWRQRHGGGNPAAGRRHRGFRPGDRRLRRSGRRAYLPRSAQG